MVSWFSRKKKSIPKGGQPAQNDAAPRVFPPSSQSYAPYNAPSTDQQAVTSVMPASSGPDRNHHYGAPREQSAARSSLAHSSSVSAPSQAPCDVCAVWRKDFERLGLDDFVRSTVLVASLLSAASNGCPICRALRDLLHRLAPYRDGTVKPANAKLAIHQDKDENGRKVDFSCALADVDDGYFTNIYCTESTLRD
jgi:hypothetical protein